MPRCELITSNVPERQLITSNVSGCQLITMLIADVSNRQLAIPVMCETVNCLNAPHLAALDRQVKNCPAIGPSKHGIVANELLFVPFKA